MDTAPSSPATPPSATSPQIILKPEERPLLLTPHQLAQQQLHQQLLMVPSTRKCIHNRAQPFASRETLSALIQQQYQMQQHMQQQQQQQQHQQQSSAIPPATTISSAPAQQPQQQPQHQQQHHPQFHQHQPSLVHRRSNTNSSVGGSTSHQQLNRSHPYATNPNAPNNRYAQHQHQSPASTPAAAAGDNATASHALRMPPSASASSSAGAAATMPMSNALPAPQPTCTANTSSNTTTTVVTTPVAPQAGAAVTIQSQAGLVHPVNAALLADRYLLLDLVDGSALYRCIDVQTQQQMVCKVVNNPCINLWRAHFRLSGHAYVNEVQQFIQGTKQSYMFFAQSQGDLHSYVRQRKRLRESEARRLFRQMCEVVKSCHEQGIVLRDLKLRKFVFADTERTHLRLESLEDAVILENPAEDLLQDKRGCPAYVSPEILRVNTTYSGKAADMWSLGVILYTMLVGRYPFNDSEHATLFVKIARGQFQIPECLSSKARCMIRSLLRRDPAERICSEDLLLHPWMRHDERRDHALPASFASGAPASMSMSMSASGGGGGGAHAYQRSLSAGSEQCVPEVIFASDDSDDSDAEAESR